MKKVFSKELLKKFFVVMMIISTITCIAPKRVQALDIGGELMQPVVDLFVGIGDGAVNIVHRIVKGQNGTLIRFGNSKKLVQLSQNLNNVATYLTNPTLFFGKLAIQSVIDKNAEELSKMKFGKVIVKKLGSNSVAGIVGYDPEDIDEDILVLPLYSVTPEEIFGGTIGLFNVNFFDTNLNQSENGVTSSDEETNIAEELQPVIAVWYTIIRGIATVGMLSMIVYIGIRILISSTSENKAKYKQLLVDWLVGFCLLFVLHYIMAFGNMFANSLSDALTSVKLYGDNENDNVITLENGDTVSAGDIKSVNKSSMTILIPKEKIENYIDEEDGKIKFKDVSVDQEIEEKKLTVESDDGTETKEMTFITWNTGLMGKLRIDTAIARETSEAYIGYSILFLVMVFFLLFFSWTYLKRVLTMAFLTLIAPFVALTYPLDKIKDGQAQAFNFWIREYIYNLLLQPLHLLLYTVLVSSAIELATEHIIYSIVALGFLVPAEKLIRQMFGFKGNTPGMLPGPAGAALVMSGMRMLLGKAPDEKDNKIDLPKPENKAKMKDVDYNAILGTQLPLGQAPRASSQNEGTPVGLTRQSILPSMSTQDSSPSSQVPEDLSQNEGTPLGLTRQTVPSSMTTPNFAPSGQVPEGSSQNGGTPGGLQRQIVPSWTSTPNSAASGQVPEGSSQNDGTSVGLTRQTVPLSMTTQNSVPLSQRQHARPGITPYAKQIGRNVGRRISNRVKKVKPTRFIAGATLGALGVGIGLAAGIASGDAGKALTYASTGAIAGNKAGRGVASVFGVEEAISTVDQAYMTPEERKAYERKKKLRSDEYKAERDLESKEVRRVLDTRMADGRTIREATMDQGYSHSDQVRLANYAATDVNHRGYAQLMEDNNLEKEDKANLAQSLFSEVDATKRLSEKMGVTTFDSLDSKTKQSKMEEIAKQVDNVKFEKYKKQRKKLEEQKEAVGKGVKEKIVTDKRGRRVKVNEGMSDEEIANERIKIQGDIDKISDKMIEAESTQRVANSLNAWGNTLD